MRKTTVLSVFLAQLVREARVKLPGPGTCTMTETCARSVTPSVTLHTWLACDERRGQDRR
jgi:hypothetical protein